ncbi:MAG: alkaline phosphatase family protein, partial [Solirubrobacteraceae bacterium]
FLMAGTAYGNISTDTSSLFDPPPPNGTIFDRLSANGLSWRNYFSDLPSSGIIGSVPQRYPANLAPIAQFFADCAAGALPAVSLVDPEFGLAGEVGGPLADAGVPGAGRISAQGQSEENPQDVQLGQDFAARVVKAVLASPAWPRTLLVWTYDEHGGYYDHVPPPKAIKPDSIPPKLGPGDVPGGYDIYGPRVPAVVVSPYSRPNAVTNVVHDHTSILATIEAKWNLPALTYRDANAATLADFLDTRHPRLLVPPTLAAPGNLLPGELGCDTSNPTLPVRH